MSSDDPTLTDYLEASDEYDVSDADKVPASIREKLNEKLEDIAE